MAVGWIDGRNGGLAGARDVPGAPAEERRRP
jgi:hypothetical protein